MSPVLNVCSICLLKFEGDTYSAAPVTGKRCCKACDDAVVTPLRVARLVGRNAAEQVAEFALMLARQRARQSPPDAVSLKEIALLVAQVIVSNAVERLYANGAPVVGGRDGA